MKKKQHNQPIRICFIAPKAYPVFNPKTKEVFGGSEVDLYLLSTELAKDENFDVSFVTADYGQRNDEIIENVRIIKSVVLKKNPFNGIWRVWKALGKARADMYMIKTASSGTFLTALFCQLHRRVFLYRSAHTDHCDGTYIKAHPILGRFFSWAVRSANIVFVQNDSDKVQLHRTVGVSPKVISNAHKLTDYNPTPRQSILWVGRSAAFKNPYNFIDLAKQFPSEKFVMICQKATGDENYDALVEAAEAIGNLEFHRRVPFHQVDSYFKCAKVLVNTSDAEGFSNTFIQAGKCATTILSFVVNPDGFLDKYSCGMSCSGDMRCLVEGLKFMLAEDRYIELGLNGRKYVADHHDITKIIDRYKKIFIELNDQRCHVD